MKAPESRSADGMNNKPGAMPHAKCAAHILVVDDDQSLRTLLRHTLSESGYTVSTAEDGQAALSVV